MSAGQTEGGGRMDMADISRLTLDLMDINSKLSESRARYYARRILEAEASEDFITMYSLLCDAIVIVKNGAIITVKE